jgi:hypothetical protein
MDSDLGIWGFRVHGSVCFFRTIGDRALWALAVEMVKFARAVRPGQNIWRKYFARQSS